MKDKIKVCSSCKEPFSSYHDSGSIMCTHCEREIREFEMSGEEFILYHFEKESDELYYSYPNGDFKPNGLNVDKFSHFADEVIVILKDILKKCNKNIIKESNAKD